MLDLTMTPRHVIAKDLHVNDPMQEKIDRKRLDKFQEIVSDQAKPFADVKFSAPIRIAVIYPSTDISDFWVRNYTAMTKRLTALEIPFEVDEYTSKQIEHSLQTQHTQTVLNAEEKYDFVIFGPSELALQTENIQKLAACSSACSLFSENKLSRKVADLRRILLHWKINLETRNNSIRKLLAEKQT